MGLDVYLVSGGPPSSREPGGEHFIQLPPLRASNHKFEQLIDASGKEIDAIWKENRCQLLLEHFARLKPHIVITESFPFGRRQLRFELIPLLQATLEATPRPLVLCSVRDIVQQRPEHRMAESTALITRFFDAVMVHGDPELIRFEDSFPRVNEIGQRLHYTGYISPPASNSAADTSGRGEVLISTGGGAVGDKLLRTALKAHSASRLKNETWHFLIGPNTPQPTAQLLYAHQSQRILVEPNRDDFLTLLRNCTVTVSQAGYNTIADILQTGARAVVVPFEGDGETEQQQRAQKLQELRVALVLREKQLSVSALAKAVDRCATQPAAVNTRFNLNGATETARFVRDSWQRHVAQDGDK